MSLKERLSERLADHPLLRTLLLNPWFAIAFVLLLLSGLALAILLPPVWTMSPPGVYPVVRVCLLDLLQARSLRATALKQAEAGDHLAAARAWQSALGNNRADPELYRGALRHLASAPPIELKVAYRTLSNAHWLLELSGTNQADLEIIAAAFDHYDMPEDVYDLLHPVADRLPPGLEGAYLKALFSMGHYGEFGKRRRQLAGHLPADPEYALYDAAFLAGWGPPGEAAPYRARLQAAMNEPAHAALACRLELAVSRQALDPDAYRAALHRLEEQRTDRPANHTQYWLLLDQVGHRMEAQRLAREFTRAPQSAADVVQMAEVLCVLDMRDAALAYLRRYSAEFGNGASPRCVVVWAAYADLLTANRDWQGLLDVARQMQSRLGVRQFMGGLGQYVEGRAAYGLGRKDVAEASFAEAAKLGFPLPQLGTRVALDVLHLGYPELALRILLPLEPQVAEDPEYWTTVFRTANALHRDDALLLKAASRAHDLNPGSRQWTVNYAAALLISRRRPEEALKITMQLLAAEPDSLTLRINHAIALAQNGRREDAVALLETLTESTLDPARRHAYYLAWLEIHAAEGHWDKAAEALGQIQPQYLFPRQRLWIEEIQQHFPAGKPNPARAAAEN